MLIEPLSKSTSCFFLLIKSTNVKNYRKIGHKIIMNPFSVSSPGRGGIALPTSRTTNKDDSTDSYEFGHQEEESGFCNKRFLFRLVGLMVTVGLLGIGLKIVPIQKLLQKKNLKETAIESVVTDSKFQQGNSLNGANVGSTIIQNNNDIISTTKETEALDESTSSSSSSSKSTNKKSSKSDSSPSSKSDSSSKDSSKESKNNNKATSETTTSTTSTTTPTPTANPITPFDGGSNNVVDIMPAYKDDSNSVEVRIQDLLSRMTLEEKTMQMVTLYGYKRVLEDRLPTRYDSACYHLCYNILLSSPVLLLSLALSLSFIIFSLSLFHHLLSLSLSFIFLSTCWYQQ